MVMMMSISIAHVYVSIPNDAICAAGEFDKDTNLIEKGTDVETEAAMHRDHWAHRVHWRWSWRARDPRVYFSLLTTATVLAHLAIIGSLGYEEPSSTG